ncbi:hypothetical protein [Vibrio neptunius]|nr:hypothetical protein [Vibrio neptunius]
MKLIKLHLGESVEQTEGVRTISRLSSIQSILIDDIYNNELEK